MNRLIPVSSRSLCSRISPRARKASGGTSPSSGSSSVSREVTFDSARYRMNECDEQAAFPALQALAEELHGEDRLARAGRAGHDVWPAGDESAVEHLVESGDPRTDLRRGRHRATSGGRGGIAVGGAGGAWRSRSFRSESQPSAIFIPFR